MIARAFSLFTGRTAGGVLFVLLAALGSTGGAKPVKNLPLAGPAKTAPISGACLDETGNALNGVKVSLYREDYKAWTNEKLGERETGADGRFLFADAPAVGEDGGLAVLATKTGLGSLILFARGQKPLEFRLRPAGTLQGRVTDVSGKPIAGATVWARSLATGRLDGVATALTDANGNYAIVDMGRWTDEDNGPRAVGNGLGVRRTYFDVRHPDFAHERPTWQQIPATIDVVLQPCGIIEGRVTDQVTGKPAAGVTVSLQGIFGMPTWDQTRADENGKFQIRCLKAGQYNLWADAPNRACAAIDSLTVTAGQNLTGQDLTLLEGGWIVGRVIDATTGRPITGTQDQPLHVACYGPGRPKSGAACQSARVDENGGFRLQVAPGLNYPYIMTSNIWSRTDGRAVFQAGIEVKPSATTTVEFRVVPVKPN